MFICCFQNRKIGTSLNSFFLNFASVKMELKYCYLIETNKKYLTFHGDTKWTRLFFFFFFRQITVIGSQVIKCKGKGEDVLCKILVT